MVRLSIVALILLCVSFIGLTFPPFEKMAYLSYNLIEPLGINPSFTPITIDMSMMTSGDGQNNFDNKISVFALDESQKYLIPAKKMKLYTEKIPIILYLEQVQDGVDLIEARFSVCNRLKKITGAEVRAFVIETENKVGASPVFNRKYSCEFS